jgi:hypothetical protein
MLASDLSLQPCEASIFIPIFSEMEMFSQVMLGGRVLLAHACNPSYSGGKNQKD